MSSQGASPRLVWSCVLCAAAALALAAPAARTANGWPATRTSTATGAPATTAPSRRPPSRGGTPSTRRRGTRTAAGTAVPTGTPVQTLGGFDQMTAIVGGLWDALLGEGRRFWIVASSDSHFHYAEPVRAGSDFWPGEFHKTWVHARPTYADVLDGLRHGRMFAVAGDLVTELEVSLTSGRHQATKPGSAARYGSRGGRRSPRPSGSATRRPRTPPSGGSTLSWAPDADLARPPGDAIADHAVETDCGQCQRQHPERGQDEGGAPRPSCSGRRTSA